MSTQSFPHPELQRQAPVPDSAAALIAQMSLARGLEEVMSIVRRGARSLTGADGVSFVLRDDGKCFYADEDAIAPLWKGQRFPMEKCISGWAMLHRQPVVIEDIYADERIPHDAYRSTFVKSLVMVPVRQEDPVAAIGAYWAHKRRPLPEEVDLLMTIANGAAVAMTNVALYASLIAAKEEAERNAIAAEQAGRAKLFILGNISHELRTPLNAILGFSELINVTGAKADPQTLDEYIGIIAQSGKHLLRLVEDLLEMSQLEDGQFRLSLEAVESVPVVVDAVEALSHHAADAGVTLTVSPAARLPLVTCDRRATRQIVMNLITNAIKFTPHGGAVDIEWAECDDALGIVIRDTGIGMSAEELSRIGEPFVQTARERNKFHQGIGLGLSIAKALTQAQGGALHIDSREGEGTVVTIYLPKSSDNIRPEPSPERALLA